MTILQGYRDEIDEIDKELVQLFEKRMDVVLGVARYKKDNNLPVFQNGREEDVIKKAVDNLDNKDYEIESKRFLNSIMSISRDLQCRKIGASKKPLIIKSVNKNIDINKKVGFQGVNGSYSEQALIDFFGEECESNNYPEFEDVFKAIESGEIKYGVLPLENSSTGAINDVYDLLNKYNFYIVAEQCVEVNHHLIGIEGATLENIKEVYSHSQGISQCSDFLKKYKEWNLIPFHNTATSAKLVGDTKDISKAAVASKRAADIYGLKIIEECINNEKGNTTRFVIISKELEMAEDADKVSVVFSLEHKAGTLYNLLRYFAQNNINMIKIESRPIKDAQWKYVLYVDFEGRLESIECQNSLKLIYENSAYFKLLGSYKNRIK